MRQVSAFVLAALATCSVSAQDARETQPSASTEVEEIYVVRSVPESSTAPTEFCAEERIGFAGATYEGHYTFRSTATRSSDGRVIDTNVKTIGSMHFCRHRTTPDSFTWYGEGAFGNTPFKGVGECHGAKADFPEQGIGTVSCFLRLSGLPSEYVGGLLTTSTMWSRKSQGMETDPSGYTQASIATIRLWRKRDAPSSAVPLTKESLVGTWRLVSYKAANEKGEMIEWWGSNPVGFLTLTADGRMSIIMADPKRKPLNPLSKSTTNAELAEALSTCFAYAGTYGLTRGQLAVHIDVSTDQNFANTDQVRFVTLEGDRLTLGGRLLVAGELVWERLKPETTPR